MRRKIVVRPKTLDDMESIYFYGLERYGLQAAEDYLNHIHKAFDNLSHFQLGRNVALIAQDLCVLPATGHLIYFREDIHWVRIIRVLHHSRDPTRTQFIG